MKKEIPVFSQKLNYLHSQKGDYKERIKSLMSNIKEFIKKAEEISELENKYFSINFDIAINPIYIKEEEKEVVKKRGRKPKEEK